MAIIGMWHTDDDGLKTMLQGIYMMHLTLISTKIAGGFYTNGWLDDVSCHIMISVICDIFHDLHNALFPLYMRMIIALE
jgi:hypothetical protein